MRAVHKSAADAADLCIVDTDPVSTLRCCILLAAGAHILKPGTTQLETISRARPLPARLDVGGRAGAGGASAARRAGLDRAGAEARGRGALVQDARRRAHAGRAPLPDVELRRARAGRLG